MKKIGKGIIIVLILNAQISQSQGVIPSIKDSIKTDSLIAFGKKFLGTKYSYSNCTPATGFDCSGFVYYVFGHFNVKVPRVSMEYKAIEPAIELSSARAGDIIVFTGPNSAIRKPGHVGIVISKKGEELTFMHSSSGKNHRGVVISKFNESSYYKKRLIKIVRPVKVYN